MEPTTTTAAPLRDLLTEAAEHRRRGDTGAAVVLDLAALVALRAIQTAARECRA